MDRSPGFGSTPKDYVAQLRLGFPTPPLKRLSLPLKVSRWPIIQKVRRHPPKGAPTACMHIISGSISLPSPGFFSPFPHGTSSLSVTEEYLGLEDGPPIFKQDFTCPALLVDLLCFYPYRTITFYGQTFQTVLVIHNRPLASSAFARHY